MKITVHCIEMLLISACLVADVHATDKKAYDIDRPGDPRPCLARTGSPYRGWELSGSVAEVAVLSGGYFSLGTTTGRTGTTLEKNQTLTYGHPYALTSFPLLSLDGRWGALPEFFTVDTTGASIAGDSLVLTYRQAGGMNLRFIVKMESGGADMQLSLDATNTDTVQHSVGLGFILDPALGSWGDGAFSIDQTRIARDTVLASPVPLAPLIAERSGSHQGLKLSIGFPQLAPQKVWVTNWNDRPDYTQPPSPTPNSTPIYDLVVKMFWTPLALLPGQGMHAAVHVGVLAPDFGSGAFMRWDLPPFLSMTDGEAFPHDLSTTAAVTNLSGALKSLSVSCTLPAEAVGSTTSFGTTPITGGTGYGHIAFSPKEIYEDRVLPFTLVCSEAGQIVDSLRRMMLIPATPVADTGLTVTIDSVASGGFPGIALILEVEKSAFHQRLFNLSPEHVFLSENGGRINEFTLGPDTSGGAKAVDIVFVLDVTGSMGEEIAGVKTNVTEFADSLAAQGVDYRLAMVTFLDAVENVYDFTSNAALFKQYVAAQGAHGGDDTPENSLDALFRASELQFRAGAARLFVWITDADYHTQDVYTQRTAAQVVDRLLSQDIVVYAIGPTYYQSAWYAPIVDPTGGKFFDITGNFRDILLDISRGRANGRFMLSYRTSAAPSGQRQVKVEVHAAGLGGFATAMYTAPGGAPVLAHGLQCYPNPFNPRVTIRVDLRGQSRAEVTVYTLLGQRVRTFLVGPSSGVSEVSWDGNDSSGRRVASGVFLVRSTVFGPRDEILGTDLLKLVHVQ